MFFEDDDRDSTPVILIGADEMAGRVARGHGERVIAFETVDEFDRWRASHARRAADIRADVVEALHELGVTIDELPMKLRAIVELFASRKVVPAVSDLEKLGSSRRSLYRMWSDELCETPSRFLRRVRLLHAERLIGSGASSKEAALRAGFGSVDRMRRLIAERRAAANASPSRDRVSAD